MVADAACYRIPEPLHRPGDTTALPAGRLFPLFCLALVPGRTNTRYALMEYSPDQFNKTRVRDHAETGLVAIYGISAFLGSLGGWVSDFRFSPPKACMA